MTVAVDADVFARYLALRQHQITLAAAPDDEFVFVNDAALTGFFAFVDEEHGPVLCCV